MGYFSNKKSLDMGPILVKKILRGGSHFTKIVKMVLFLMQKNPLEMGLILRKILKKLSNQLFLEWEKSTWVGVSDIGPHIPSKSNTSTPWAYTLCIKSNSPVAKLFSIKCILLNEISKLLEKIKM